MGKYVVEINDTDGNTGRIQLSLPFAKKQTKVGNSSWRTLTQGFIKHHSGGCQAITFGKSRWGAYDIYLFSGKYYGVILDGFIDDWGSANDSGSGRVLQPWCLQCEPGEIGWTLD